MLYAELHCKTNFSFLEGASHPDELVARAAELGYRALAITDRNSLAGVVRAHGTAKQVGLPLMIGAELTPLDAPPVVLWATDRAAYGRLARLLTVGRRRAPKGKCWVQLEDIAQYQEGLLAGVVPSWTSEHPDEVTREESPLADEALDPHDPDRARSFLQTYREIFGRRCYLLAEVHRGPDDERYLAELGQLARETRVPLVAAGGVLYHSPRRLPLQDVLTAIRYGTTVEQLGERMRPNAERHLQPLEQLARRFASVPDALRRSLEVAERCRFSLDELRYEYPEELAPPGLTPFQYLTQLTWKGAHRRYAGQVPLKVRQLIEHELRLIQDLRYEAYFLTVWDLIRFARQRGILCQGRGSAANSAVCYCLGITSVDPDRTDVLFERFVSRERDEAPDIDVDFEHERREEVLQYVYEKYGRERAGIAATVITYRWRSAIRDVGKALGLSLDRVDALAKLTTADAEDARLHERCRQAGLDPESPVGQRLMYLVREILGFPRHLSQHVGGMVITRGPLCELAPLENAAMEGRTVVQWDKDDLDELGILKVDCLALGMLTAIRRCFDFVQRHYRRRLTLATVPAEDPAVYDMICQADTVGVFQIESRAQMSMLPRLRPRCFYDLVIEVAIVRPGPIQGQMVHPYLRRRAGEEEPSYPNEEIRQVLHKTLGVPIFQEQAMRLAVVAAGFTPGEADQLRRAMGAWRRPGVIDQFHRRLIEGMRARGLSQEFAEQVFLQIRGFGEYGFPESHSASFALLVYVSAWLKCHYPAAFTAALLNSQPMGFYAPAQLVRDARQHDIAVRGVDVNFSEWDCTLERIPSARRDAPPRFAVRLGFRLIRGFPRAVAERILAARGTGPFASWDEFVARTRLSRVLLARLADADAFASLSRSRRKALWSALGQPAQYEQLPLFDKLAVQDEEELPAGLPRMETSDEVLADYRTTGLSLKAHPMSFYREQLEAQGIVPAARLLHLRSDRLVRVAGIVLLRQRPGTAKGITFVTLEDETGTANLVVKHHIWQRYVRIASSARAWVAHGYLQHAHGVVHLVVQRLEDLSDLLGDLQTRARDFH